MATSLTHQRSMARDTSLEADPPYKRVFDLCVVVGAHLLLLPVFLLLWVVIPLAIWLDDRGPVFYTQLRVGKGGKPFTVIKFRTMVRGADRVVRPWTLPGRDHVTRVGSLLRPMALDELPQVLNILRGEMSLVGPRAMPVEEYAVYQPRIPGFNRRFGVRPGLTGMAQVCARAIRNNHEKLVHDLEYVDHMSLWLDIRLLLLSVFNTVRRAWETPHACRTPRAAQPWHRAAPRAVALAGAGSADGSQDMARDPEPE